MTNLIALPNGTELVGDYRIDRVLGAGGFGITYLADELALSRPVTIKEYFPSDFAARTSEREAAPRSQDCAGDYRWGLERFLDEAQTLARFNHPNIVRVYRYFRANNTGYMVLHFEEGQSLKSWLKSLGRAPRQNELDRILEPLLDALAIIHDSDYLHRDIAPDNIIIRKGGEPVLIDFGSARGEIAAHSKTVSALVKPGYSPYEQYAERSSQQGPWTDIYALGATLYHAVTGKRPPDSPSRMVKDEFVPAREAALSSYRPGFLKAIDRALALPIKNRPQSVAAWRGDLLAPEPPRSSWLSRGRERLSPATAAASTEAITQPLPDVPGPQGGLLDFVEKLRSPEPAAAGGAVAAAVAERPPPGAATARGTLKVDPAPAPKVLLKGRKAKADAPAAKPAPTPAKPTPKAPSEGKAAALERVPNDRALVPVAPQRRAPPRPARTWKGPRLRPLLFKLAIGACVASAAVAMQDHLPQVASPATTPAMKGSASAPQPIAKPAPPTTLPLGELRGHTGAIAAVAYTEDGRSIVSTGDDKTLRVWNAANGSLLRTVPLGDSKATSIAVNGSRVLTGHDDGLLQLWSLDQDTPPQRFKRNDAGIWSVAFTSDPNRFVAAAHDWKVALWDAHTATAPIHIFDGHESAAQAVAFSGVRRVIASGSADRSVKLWSLDTLDLERTYRGHKDFVTALAFSPDGRLLASSSLDGGIRLWSATSGRLQRMLNGHKDRVGALAFSPRGDTMASVSDDGQVRLWDVKRGRAMRTLVAAAGPIKSVAFQPDGRRIAAAGSDGVIRLWPVISPLPRRGG